MEKVLVLVGDAAEDLDAMYPIYRLREAGYEVHVAAPTRRKVKLVVHDFEEASGCLHRAARATPSRWTSPSRRRNPKGTRHW